VEASPPRRRGARPDDLYRISVPTDPRLTPDGGRVVFTVQTVAPGADGYRTAIWAADAPGAGRAARAGSEAARRLTIGARKDRHPRPSPDGRALAFLSDRRSIVEDEPKAPKEREDVVQVHVLPLDSPGEARRLTDLPRGVESFAWAPDGRRLIAVSFSRAARRDEDARLRRKAREPRPGEPPRSDYRFTDRLGYLANGQGFVRHRVPQLWLVDAVTGEARRLTDVEPGATAPAWSPDGRHVAFVTGPREDHDLRTRHRVLVLDVETGEIREVAAHPEGIYLRPVWLPDGERIAVMGGTHPHVGYRNEIRLFAADGSEAKTEGRDLTGRFDVMPASGMNSDVTTGEDARLRPTGDGRGLLFLAPIEGSMELWRVGIEDGSLDRLTDGKHYLSAFDAVATKDGAMRIAAIRSAPIELPDVHVCDLGRSGARNGRAQQVDLRRVSDLNAGLAGELELREPIERRWEVDGRRIQGWLIPAGDGPRPTVLEIHGGPHTLYGYAPVLEFQILAATGISVLYANPRGSEGYGRDFNEANLGDWGPGPMRDLLAGIDAIVTDGLADPDRLGVTGGSYGGYLTNWIVAHDHRFKAAFTARSVADMTMLFLTGDLSGTDWPEEEFGAYPWDDPELFRRISPITYAREIRTPLLIQHSDDDLRTTVAQAEALFAVLRRHRRPVRLMRVPSESHELTRSGTPFRRVENLVQVRDWFRHYLIDGKRRLPPLPLTKNGS
jgi:dipeptidyl aminopeptidase/acylaminoacyl peptidase